MQQPDYIHVKNNILHAIPYHKHLEVRVGSKTCVDRRNWKCSEPVCKVKVICGVAVIAFIFPDPKSNIVLHLNYAQLKSWGPVSWLGCKEIMFMLFLLDSTDHNMIISSKVVKINERDTSKIRAACLEQSTLPVIAVERAVDFIYQFRISELWP